jgi:hypothetical protein
MNCCTGSASSLFPPWYKEHCKRLVLETPLRSFHRHTRPYAVYPSAQALGALGCMLGTALVHLRGLAGAAAGGAASEALQWLSVALWTTQLASANLLALSRVERLVGASGRGEQATRDTDGAKQAVAGTGLHACAGLRLGWVIPVNRSPQGRP